MIEEIFKKTEKTCNNVYLIDERLCLKDSVDIINSNFTSISAAYNKLLKVSDYYNQLYTIFTTNSANWENGALNTNIRKEKFNGAYSLVKNLSSTWVKEFAIIYPKIINIETWTSNIQKYKTDIIPNWLYNEFPLYNFATNQIIYVYINLYHNQEFSVNFSGEYKEVCGAPSSSDKVKCVAGTAYQNCNHTSGKGKNKEHWCTNVYDACHSSAPVVEASAKCNSSGSKTLKIQTISSSYVDRYTAKCLYFAYKKISDEADKWVLI